MQKGFKVLLNKEADRSLVLSPTEFVLAWQYSI